MLTEVIKNNELCLIQNRTAYLTDSHVTQKDMIIGNNVHYTSNNVLKLYFYACKMSMIYALTLIIPIIYWIQYSNWVIINVWIGRFVLLNLLIVSSSNRL